MNHRMRPPYVVRLAGIASLLGLGFLGGCGGKDSHGPPPADSGAVLVATVPVPANYGIHDTFVRDGLAFVCAWNTGVLIYDVGNGIKSGTPAHPVLVGSVVTVGGEAHNAWWFQNPVTSEKKYLFVGQEGLGQIGVSSSGDIHVLDVSDLTAPHEVAFFHLGDVAGHTTGTHNFWMDEPNQVLYAAYYNGGVVALDVSGALSGDLSSRIIDTIAPGVQPYIWGVQLANGSVYASDMLNGLWQLNLTSGVFSVAGGGGNVTERYTSDLWVHGSYAYSGTWNFRGSTPGNALKVWHLDPSGAPTLVDSIITGNIATVSDVEVSADGKLLMFGAEGGGNNGFHFYSLADPAHPTFISKYLVGSGIHTASFGYIGGRVYAFGAKDPSSPALVILDVTSLMP